MSTLNEAFDTSNLKRSKPIIAKPVLRKELSHGIRFAKFECKCKYAGGKYSDSFDIVTQDYEFEAVWTINCSYTNGFSNEYFCTWTKIEIRENKCKNIFGNFLFHAESGLLYTGAFDFSLSPFEQELSYFCPKGTTTINLEVIREDERLSIIENYDKF